MGLLTEIERAVLDSASDDYENLEQLYKSIALEFSSAAYQSSPDAFYWRAASPPVFLSEIADAVYRLSVAGFLDVRQDDGRVREDFRDASFVWRDWFRANQP